MTRTLITLLATTCAFASPALAESYGGFSLAYVNNDVIDNGNAEGTAEGYAADWFVGYRFSPNIFVEAEVNLQTFYAVPASNDSLQYGELGLIRAGWDGATWRADGFIGAFNGEGDEGTTIRTIFGASGAYEFNDVFAATGHLSYVDGTNGTDDNGLDGPSEWTTFGVGASYAPLDNVVFDFSYFIGKGIMDDDNPRDEAFELEEFSIGGSYDFNDNASVFARYTRTDMFQGPNENDSYEEDTFEIGLQLLFGNQPTGNSRARMATPDYARWAAGAAGVLE